MQTARDRSMAMVMFDGAVVKGAYLNKRFPKEGRGNLALKTTVRLERLSGGRRWRVFLRTEVLRVECWGHNQSWEKQFHRCVALPPLLSQQVLYTISSGNLCRYCLFPSLPLLPPPPPLSPFLSLSLLNLRSSCSQWTETCPLPDKISMSANHSSTSTFVFFIVF